MTTSTSTRRGAASPLRQLSLLDRYLTLWVFLAIAVGAVIGPLIEVPVMIGLVNVAFWFQN